MLVISRNLFLLCLGAVFVLSFGGCCTVGIGTCTITDVISLTNESGQLNACGDDHKSHPVVVRFFYLKDTDQFIDGSFKDIWDNPRDTLGDALEGSSDDTSLVPGAEATIALIRPEGAVAIAMMINFCEEGDNNRYVFSLKDQDLKKTVNLDNVSFSVK